VSNEKQTDSMHQRDVRKLEKALTGWMETGNADDMDARQLADELEEILERVGLNWDIVFAK
jgi:hypothetical protein